MTIKYKIVEVHPEQHCIVVRFYSDVVTEASLMTQCDEAGAILRCRTDYNIDLPVPAPTGVALEKLISAQAPVAWLTTQESILDPLVDTSLAAALALLGVESVVLAPSPPAPPVFDVGAAPV